jgi:ABC-type Na+ efflux pump permease subunit
MLMELVNLALASLLGILYMFLYIIIINKFLKGFATKKNNAILILFTGAIFSAGINLNHVSELSSAAFHFYFGNSNLLMAILSYVIFFSSMFVFSYVFFVSSFTFIGALTKENESAELAKNNIEIAIIHASILIILSFVIAPALISFATQFIPYPKTPF